VTAEITMTGGDVEETAMGSVGEEAAMAASKKRP
jgi:hypothetical protein